ncbi:MAG: hypothetical protein ACF8Q5_07795 [Phycisphaerales bacterium JB040]
MRTQPGPPQPIEFRFDGRSLHDDAGERVQLGRTIPSPLSVPRDLLYMSRGRQRALTEREYFFRIVYYSVLSFGVVTLLAVLIQQLVFPKWSVSEMLSTIATIEVIMLACFAGSYLSRRRAVVIDHATKFLSRGCCPGCGYSLADIGAREAGDRIRCPECGAVWLGERLPSAPTEHGSFIDLDHNEMPS